LCPVKGISYPGAWKFRTEKMLYVDIGIFGKMPNQKIKEVGGSMVSFKAIEQFNVDNNG